MTAFLPASFSLLPGYADLSAAGTTQADAAPIAGSINIYADVPAGSGVVLPQAYASGAQILVFNRAANAMNVYPARDAQIESLGVDVPYVVSAGDVISFYCMDEPLTAGRQWYVGVDSQVASGVSSFNSRAGAVSLGAADIAALDLSGLPTTNPGGGKVWLNGGVLQVGA